MKLKLSLYREKLDTILSNGGNNINLGLNIFHATAHIVTKDFPMQEDFILYFGRILRGKDGKSAYQAAVDGGFKGSETVFQSRLAALTNVEIDNEPTENSLNLVRSGGVQRSIEENKPRWKTIKS